MTKWNAPALTTRGRWWGLLALLGALMTADVRAHNLGESYLYLRIYREQLAGRFEISFEDLNKGFELTGTGARDHERRISTSKSNS